MTKKSDAPAIRFKGFSDAWEQRKLGELVDVCSGRDYKHLSEGTIPVYGTGGYMLSVNDALSYDRDAIGIGRKGTIDRPYILKAPFWTVDTLFYAIPREKVDLNFAFDIFQNIDWKKKDESTGVPSLSKTAINDIDVLAPKHDEQQTIGQFFAALDDLITLHQRKFEKLTNVKKSMLEKMFPQNGSSYPEIRFKGFTDPWEQRKVGDLLIERNQQAPMSDEYPLMAFIANEGVAPKGERYDRSALVTDTVNKLYKKTEKGDFIYSSNNLETGSIGLNKYGKACISPVYSIFEPTGIADSDFLGRRLVRKDFINAMVKWRQGVIYGQWRIHESDFLKIEITVPSVEEQRKIGAYLDQLDNLITLHQRKCANLCSPSQVVFSLLFATSTFSWEQRKVQDVADRFDNLRIPVAANLRVHGTTPYYGANGIQDYVEGFTHDGEFVLVAEDGANDLKNYPVKCVNGRIWVNNHAHVLQGKAGISDNSFLAFAISQSDIESLLVGGSRAKLNAETLMSIEFKLPCLQEQYRIGEYLTQLDHLITLHQRECISFTGRADRLILTANKKRTTSSWEQRKLGDIADIVGGGTPSTGNQSYWDGDIDWYAPAEIADQIYANSSQKKITGLGYENSSAKMLPPGTVLFTSRAGIGKTAILTRKGCTNQGFQSIVPHRGELDSYFIFSRTGELKRYGELVGAGSTFVEVSGKQMAVMELMMPPTMREQQTIGGFFQQLDHLITLHQRKPFLMKWRTSDANRNQTNRLVL